MFAKIPSMELARMAQAKRPAIRTKIISELRARGDRSAFDAHMRLCTREDRLGARARFPVDLQTHSLCSDGDYLPEEVVYIAWRTGVGVIGLTDHSSVAGFERARSAGEKLGVEVLRGTEVFVGYPHEDLPVIHLLAYGFDEKNGRFRSLYTHAIALLQGRIRQETENYAKLGISVDFKAFVAERPGFCSNKHLIELRTRDILEAKAKEDDIDFFEAHRLHFQWARDAADREMYRGGPVFVKLPPNLIDAKEFIDATHEAGGVVVIGHPGEYEGKITKRGGNAEDFTARMFDHFLNLGIDGLEASSTKHRPEREEHYRKFAQDNHLMATGGSDFHGYETAPERILGSAGLSLEEFAAIRHKLERKPS